MLYLYAILALMVGLMAQSITHPGVKDNPDHHNLDTVQKRTMFTLGMLWDDKDTHICKTKNYLVKVKIVGDCDKSYCGLSYPIVSINGSPYVETKAYGDMLQDGQEWVFYHDGGIMPDDKDFIVRFNEYNQTEQNPHFKAQCYFETEIDNNEDRVHEYGKYIIHDHITNQDY